MENTTITKQTEYLNAWNSHIDGLNALIFTPSKKLSSEVAQAINNLRHLVIKVAVDKGL